MIYEYALTEPDGVALDQIRSNKNRLALRKADLRMTKCGCSTYSRDKDFATTLSEIHEPNQLRYVCRQLCQETSGLSIRYNDVYISSEWLLNYTKSLRAEYVLFDNFISCCSSDALDRLRRIVIYDTTHDDPTSSPLNKEQTLSSNLIRFCRERPNITVIVRFNWFDLWANDDAGWLLGYMVDIAVCLRKSNHYPFSHTENSHLLFMLIDCPKNLRFSLTHYLGPKSVDLGLLDYYGYAEEDIEKYREVVIAMHENGI